MALKFSWCYTFFFLMFLQHCEQRTLSSRPQSYNPFSFDCKHKFELSHAISSEDLEVDSVEVSNISKTDHLQEIEELVHFASTSHVVLNIKNIPVQLLQFMIQSPVHTLKGTLKMLSKLYPYIDIRKIFYLVRKVRKFPSNLEPRKIKQAVLELEEFIINLVEKNNINSLSNNLYQLVLKYVDLPILIVETFRANKIPVSIKPDMIELLLHLMLALKTQTPVTNVPRGLIELILKSNVPQDLVDFAVDWENKNGEDSKVQLFIQAVNEGKTIPSYLKNWILKNPKGQQILEMLDTPGDTKCDQLPDGSLKCVKKIPVTIETELVAFIFNILDNKYTDVSPELLEFIQNYPQLENLIKIVFQDNNIPQIKVNSNMITELLNLVIKAKTNQPLGNIPEWLINFVLKLKQATHLLNWLNKQSVVKEGKILKNLDTALPDEQKVTGSLEQPVVNNCEQTQDSTNCVTPKKQLQLIEKFVSEINKQHNTTKDIVEHYKYAKMFGIADIFQTNTIAKRMKELLQILGSITMEITNEVLLQLIDLTLSLQKEEYSTLSDVVLNWVQNHKKADLTQFIWILTEHNNNIIPEMVLKWLNEFSVGEEIIKFLEGDINCHRVIGGSVICFQIKRMQAVPENLESELFKFIYAIQNNEFIEFSPDVLHFIIKYPHVETLIQNIFEFIQIPVIKVDLIKINQLINILRNIDTDTPPRDIPMSTLELILNLKGAKVLSTIVLNWIIDNARIDRISLFIQIVKHNDGRLPENLREWILTLPDKHEILSLLYKPEDFECSQKSEDIISIKCIKIEPAIPESIQSELTDFITAVNNGELQQISAQMLQFILKYPDLKQLIQVTFENHNIPQSNINTLLILDLLNLMKDVKINSIIEIIPQSIIKFVLKLKGAKELSKFVLNWVKLNTKIDMIQLFLQVIKDNGGNLIPDNLQEFILTLPNGLETIEFLEIPGDIECNQELECVKKLIQPVDLETIPKDFTKYVIFPTVPKDVIESTSLPTVPPPTSLPTVPPPTSLPTIPALINELEIFIIAVANNKLYDISPSLLQTILAYPELQKQIEIIFETNNTPQTTVNPVLIIELLNLMKDKHINAPLNNIPLTLIELVLNLKGAEDLSTYILNWVKVSKKIELDQLFLQVIKDNNEGVPHNLKEWILTQPNGQETIKFLEEPGYIECEQEQDNKVHCVKKVIHIGKIEPSTEDTDEELHKFIIATSNNKLYDLSFESLQLILNYPDLQNKIQDIIKNDDTPQKIVNPVLIMELLNLMKDIQINAPIIDISQTLIEFVLNLKGAKELTTQVLNWLHDNKNIDILKLSLKVIKDNGGKIIPNNLKEWITTLPNGLDILEFLEKPGYIECTDTTSGETECVKHVKKSEVSMPEYVKEDLQMFVNAAANNKLYELSPDSLQIILKYPELEKRIQVIFESDNIPQTNVNPLLIIKLLNLMNNMEIGAPINDVPLPLLNLVVNLKGAAHLITYVFNKIQDNEKVDMLQLFIQLAKDNNGIPNNLKEWIMTLSSGPEIIEFLEQPGNIECTDKPNGRVECIKHAIISGVSNPEALHEDLKKFINATANKKLYELSPDSLQLILEYPELQNTIQDIFVSNNIPQTLVNPLLIIKLLKLMKNTEMNAPINDVPQSLIELILNLKGASDLTTHLLNWVQENKKINMMLLFVKVIKDNGGHIIPDNLKEWILTLSNGPEVIEFLEKPGNIEYLTEPDVEQTLPVNVDDELQKFIVAAANNELYDMSPSTIQFILEYPELQRHIQAVFENNQISQTKVNSDLMIKLLHLMRDKKINASDISENLIKLVLDLKGAHDLSTYVLNWVQHNTHIDLIQLFQHVIKVGKEIPLNLRNWIITLTNWKDIIKFFENDKNIDCKQDTNGDIFCSQKAMIHMNKDKKIDIPATNVFNLNISGNDLPTYMLQWIHNNNLVSLPSIPGNINEELVKFIIAINNKELNTISPKLQLFIIKYPDTESLIDIILENNNISSSIDSETIAQFLKFIIDYKQNTQIKHVPQSIIGLLLNLKGTQAQYLSNVALKWVQKTKPNDMLQIFLEVIHANGGKVIPQNLRQWLLSLDNGKEILEYLEKPGDIECNRRPDDSVHCVKTITHSRLVSYPEDTFTELTKFIYALNNNELNAVSPGLLQFIVKYPDLKTLIELVVNKSHIAQMTLDSQKIAQLLQLIIDINSNKTLHNIPQWLIELVINFKGVLAQSLSNFVINWVRDNQQDSMINLFLKVIRDNGGKVIPPNLRSWLMTFSKGKEIMRYLELPGDIECEKKSDDTIYCVKKSSLDVKEIFSTDFASNYFFK